MEVACVIVVVLIAVTALGHGIWVFVAGILQSIFGAPTEPKPRVNRLFRDCPACGAETESEDLDCVRCGLALDSGLARKLSRIRTAETEVHKLQESGDLDPDTAKAVSQRLRRRAKALRGLPSGRPRVAAPVPPATESTASPTPAPTIIPKAEPESIPVPVGASVAVIATGDRDEEISPPTSPAIVAPEDRSPAAPRRGSVVAAFMEERNILWGELVGGLLIVGCSIALVVTLWRSLETIPYFPFLLSTLITLALYGAGQYTLHHWKLTATSRGLLVISLLLTPLNLLLLSDDITRGAASGPIDAVVKLTAIALFAWVVRGGGRDILIDRSGWRWPLALAVAGPAATQLIPAGWIADSPVDLPAWLALACFAAGTAIVLRDRRGLRIAPESVTVERSAGPALLSFVGLAVFGLMAAWGLHLARAANVAGTVGALAAPLALSAIPIVEAGLLVYRRSREGGLRAAGTAVALAGLLAMTAAVAAAWPDPFRVLLVSLMVGLFLTRIAFRESLPWAQAGAIPALALAVVIGYHGLAGHWQTAGAGVGLIGIFFPAASIATHLDAEGGVVLAAFGLLLAGLAEVLVRVVTLCARDLHAVGYALGGAACGLVGLFLVNINGIEFPLRAAAVCGACAVGLLGFNYRWKLRVCAHGGFWLILVGSIWLLHAEIPIEFARWGFALALEAPVLAILSLSLLGIREGATAILRRGARDVSIAAVILAGVFGFVAIRQSTLPWHTATLFTLSLTGLVLTRSLRSPIPTYLASASALLDFLHMTTLAIGWRPIGRALLVALLAHASLTIATAFVFRRANASLCGPLVALLAGSDEPGSTGTSRLCPLPMRWNGPDAGVAGPCLAGLRMVLA